MRAPRGPFFVGRSLRRFVRVHRLSPDHNAQRECGSSWVAPASLTRPVDA